MVEAHRFQDSQHLMMVRLSALCTGLLYPQEVLLALISVRGLSAARRIMSMKNFSDTVGYQSHDLLAYILQLENHII